MKKILTTAICILLLLRLSAQQERASIRAGNKLYKEKQYQASLQEYNKAVSRAPGNEVANYNQGNALVRTNMLDDAITSFDNSIAASKKKPVKEKGYYNKGVALSKQQKLQESIEAWKAALKLDPDDQQARENLQKALLELKKQQEQQKKQEDEKKNKKEQNKKQDKDQQQPKQQSKLTQKQVEQLLKALQQKEKEVQDKLQSKNASPNRQDKDW